MRVSSAGKISVDRGHDRQRVLEATDVVRLVGEHVALRGKGREYVGLCPFHDDHKPSMYVVPGKGIYHCFSCGAGGNAIDFVMNFHKMEFREALEHLAERAGVELTPWRRDDAGPGREGDGGAPARGDLLAASAFAADFFRVLLRHPEHGQGGRDLLERRGISAEMVEAFEIGVSPDRWDGLALTAEKKGVRLEALRALGLVKQREQGGPSSVYDAFRHRLIFPIHDQIGRPVAFGGRKIRDEDEPKYLNSPESALFDKSRTLFGLKQAFRSIQREKRAIVVEGYVDTIACHQAGVTNAVATLGTSLTVEHARMLERVCESVVLVFDGDEAGARAADRAVEVFFAFPIDVKIAVLSGPAGNGAKDPDDLLKQERGRERFDALIAGGRDALDYRFDRLKARMASMGMSARARAVEEDIARLSELGLSRVSPVRRRLVLKRLAALAGVGEEDVLDALRKSAPRFAPAATGEVEAAAPAGPAQKAADSAVGAMLCEPSMWAELSAEQRDALSGGAYAPALTAAVAQAAVRVLDTGATPSVGAVIDAAIDGEVRRHAAALAGRAEVACEGDAERLRTVAVESLAYLMRLGAAEASRAMEAGASEGVESMQRRLDEHRRLRERFGGVAAVMPGVVAPRSA